MARALRLALILVVAACTPSTDGTRPPSPSAPNPSSGGSIAGLYTCKAEGNPNAPLEVLELRADGTMTWTGGIPTESRWSSDAHSGVAYGWAFTIVGDQLNFAGSGAPFDVCTPAG